MQSRVDDGVDCRAQHDGPRGYRTGSSSCQAYADVGDRPACRAQRGLPPQAEQPTTCRGGAAVAVQSCGTQPGNRPAACIHQCSKRVCSCCDLLKQRQRAPANHGEGSSHRGIQACDHKHGGH